jgi:hypothetical protein
MTYLFEYIFKKFKYTCKYSHEAKRYCYKQYSPKPFIFFRIFHNFKLNCNGGGLSPLIQYILHYYFVAVVSATAAVVSTAVLVESTTVASAVVAEWLLQAVNNAAIAAITNNFFIL